MAVRSSHRCSWRFQVCQTVPEYTTVNEVATSLPSFVRHLWAENLIAVDSDGVVRKLRS